MKVINFLDFSDIIKIKIFQKKYHQPVTCIYRISRIVAAAYRLANRSIINAINRSHFENLSWRNMQNNPIISSIINITPSIKIIHHTIKLPITFLRLFLATHK